MLLEWRWRANKVREKFESEKNFNWISNKLFYKIKLLTR